MPDPEILAGCYRLVRLLGRGASCDVYEAVDLAHGSTVALKRFREPSLEALIRIKSEFRTLADLHIPGLVRFFDLVVSEDAAFFTMELVDGVVLTEYARSASCDELRGALGRVAHALGELHARGHLHRDLKPANILVTRGGEVRVLDFGLAGVAGSMAGTLVYMAPELFEGCAPGPASDWYSFGVVLYELLAGRVPAGGDIAEILVRKQLRRFPGVREVNPAAAPELADLAWALLEPDPAHRAGRAAVAAGLAQEPRDDAMPGAAMFGRDGELARLRAAYARALDGRPTVVVVEGESGMGKSSLVRWFLAGAADRFALRSAARPQESVPLRALDAMIDELAQVIAGLPAAERAAIAAELPRALVSAFPVLGALDGDAASREPAIGDALAVRREAQLAFAGVLRRLAAIRPVVLWIDDLQWADYESLLFLDAVVAHAGDAPLFVVLSRRPIPLAWPDREAWLAGFERIPLAPLSDDAARALLDAHTARHPMTDAAIARALEDSGGNAFLLEFLARHTLRDRGRNGVVEVSSALRAALDGLDRDARALFECVSLAQHPVPLVMLGRVLDDRAGLRGHTARLAAEGLISLDERDCARPYHDALRERADAALDPDTRRSRHSRLARAFGDSGAPIEWQIPHLEGAGQHEAAAQASITAGRAAAARYAFEIAAAYFTRALALAELDAPTRARVVEALADNLAAAGNGRAAAARYREAAEVLGASDSRAALAMHHKAAIALLRSGELAAGRAALEDTLHRLGERLPRWAMLASIYEALRLAIAAKLPVRRRLAPRAELRLDTLWTSATTLSMYDPFVANALTLRFVRRALAAGQPRWVVRALALEAAFLAALGGRFRARADRTMTELRAQASRIEQPYETAWVAATEGSTAWLRGDVQRCYDWTARARELWRGVPGVGAYEIALLDSFRLPAMALLGHHGEVLRSADDVLAIARARGDGFATLPCLHGHITLAYLGAGQIERAAEGADEASAIARHASSPMPTYHQAWSRATLALFDRDGARAHRVIAAAWGPLRRSGMLRLEAVAGDLRYLRARCALAAARGLRDDARARGLRDAAAQAHWLRGSTLAYGAVVADAIDAQRMALTGRECDGRARAAAASAALRRLGLVLDGDALARWSAGEPLLPIDRVYVG
jgi:tRNA A-37 threonylcarbamoyl transferase component Bud32